MKSFVLDPFAPSHLGDGFARYANIPARVIALLNGSRPSAVAGLVVAIVVVAFNLMTFGTRAHVSDEVRVTITPSVANLDAAPTVTVEFIRARVVAARLHPSPYAVLAGARRSASSPVNAHLRGRHVSSKASATLNVPCPQRPAVNIAGVSALALASPERERSARADSLDRNESAEPLSRKVDKRWHFTNYTSERDDAEVA